MTAFNKDQFDALMALVQHRRELRESRMRRQWEASFAAWGAAAFLVWQGERLDLGLRIAGALIVFALHAGWILWHSEKAEADQTIMREYHDDAAAMLGKSLPTGSTKAWWEHPPVWLQLGLTMLLLAAAVVAGGR